ncbi:MAG: SDR family oxidoreductase [Candidatus Tectomicrobia bacterium]|uniref:SDR family oxidoreductase n=1 Tax=Tectimicrobiota bacterium TaxID=2528274 RepID=A0A932CPM6_UNCTE|nr:SDR family oxidoreductase [Candidatus Tectomicrobia bacterium]
MRLQGKVAVITGGGSGLGRGQVLCLAQEGAAVVVADLNFEAARKVAMEAREGGTRTLPLRVDVTREEDLQEMLDRTRQEFGTLDILVNNAGVGGNHIGIPFTDLQDADWDLCYEVNLKAVFKACKQVAPQMIRQGGGRIINISSIAGKTGNELLPHYCASKAGVISLTQALAKELARHNITVNAVCPGLIWTPLWNHLAQMIKAKVPRYHDDEPRAIFDDWVKKLIPLGREQTAEDIGKVVAFLASDDAKNITGQAINVDGGAELH